MEGWNIETIILAPAVGVSSQYSDTSLDDPYVFMHFGPTVQLRK